MGLNIFFAEDISNALQAANEASSATAEAATSQDARTLDLIAEKLRRELPEGTNQVLLDALHAAAIGSVDTLKHYRQGYRAALVTLALAFGLSPAIIDGGRPLKVSALSEGEVEGPVLSPEHRRRVEGASAIDYQPSAIGHPPEKR